MTDRLDMRGRASRLETAARESVDLVVIGGGISGAGVARDAALRGLSVVLVEARDLASGTSSRSTKLIHGGLRYLAQGNIPLVRESALERQVARRVAPHLAVKCPFVIPVKSRMDQAKFRTGLWTFEKLGAVDAADRHQSWSAKELAREEPLVKADGFVGAVVYTEYLTDDARLTLANIRSAQAAGATVATYAEAVAIGEENGQASRVTIRGTLPGEDWEVTLPARMIVNAGGPWVDKVRQLEDARAPGRLMLTKGIHLVVPRARLPLERTVLTHAADGRTGFAVPRGSCTYLGTTDTFYADPDYWPEPTPEDAAYVMEAARLTFGEHAPGLSDVSALWSGVRPLIGEAGKAPSEISRKDEIWTGPSGVVTLAGGKLTAYRRMAERVVDLVVERLGVTALPCTTADAPLAGGDHDADTLPRDPALVGCDPDTAHRLIHLYGTEAPAIAAAGGTAAAEARHAVEAEGALTLEDYWVRRSARAWFDTDAGLTVLAEAAEAMAPLLGWDDEARRSQIETCETRHREAMAPVVAAAQAGGGSSVAL